jgi:hypothetical protein
VDLAQIEAAMARLDAMYRPVATKPVDVMDPRRAHQPDQPEAVLRAVVESYATGDEGVRQALRRLFDRCPTFR